MPSKSSLSLAINSRMFVYWKGNEQEVAIAIYEALELSSPVFVIGCPRSGTSALAWALAKHPKFWTSAESNFLVDILKPTGRIRSIYDHVTRIVPDQKGWLNRNSVTFEEMMAYLGSGIDQLYLSRSRGRRWVEQSPSYTLICTELAYLFPNAKFLHALRDGTKVVNSMIHSNFNETWSTDFEIACRTWQHYVDLVLEFQNEFPDRVLEVRNEALISDRKPTTHAILNFLDEEPSDDMAIFLETRWVNSSFGSNRETPPSPWTSWTADQRSTFRRIAGERMHVTGYSIPFG